MLQQLRIGVEFHHLWVYEHELQLRRMLRIKQRRDDDIQTDRLALFGRTRHQKMRRLRQVEDLDFLGNGIPYRNRQFVFVVPECFIIEKGLQRYYGRTLVRHLYADRIRKPHYPHPMGIQRHGYVLLEIPDGGNLHARRRCHLIESHCRALTGYHVLHLYLIVEKGCPYLVVVPFKFLLRNIMPGFRIILQQVEGRELISVQFLPRVNTRKFADIFRRKILAFENLHLLFRPQFRFLIFRTACSVSAFVHAGAAVCNAGNIFLIRILPDCRPVVTPFRHRISLLFRIIPELVFIRTGNRIHERYIPVTGTDI